MKSVSYELSKKHRHARQSSIDAIVMNEYYSNSYYVPSSVLLSGSDRVNNKFSDQNGSRFADEQNTSQTVEPAGPANVIWNQTFASSAASMELRANDKGTNDMGVKDTRRTDGMKNGAMVMANDPNLIVTTGHDKSDGKARSSWNDWVNDCATADQHHGFNQDQTTTRNHLQAIPLSVQTHQNRSEPQQLQAPQQQQQQLRHSDLYERRRKSLPVIRRPPSAVLPASPSAPFGMTTSSIEPRFSPNSNGFEVDSRGYTNKNSLRKSIKRVGSGDQLTRNSNGRISENIYEEIGAPGRSETDSSWWSTMCPTRGSPVEIAGQVTSKPAVTRERTSGRPSTAGRVTDDWTRTVRAQGERCAAVRSSDACRLSVADPFGPQPATTTPVPLRPTPRSPSQGNSSVPLTRKFSQPRAIVPVNSLDDSCFPQLFQKDELPSSDFRRSDVMYHAGDVHKRSSAESSIDPGILRKSDPLNRYYSRCDDSPSSPSNHRSAFSNRGLKSGRPFSAVASSSSSTTISSESPAPYRAYDAQSVQYSHQQHPASILNGTGKITNGIIQDLQHNKVITSNNFNCDVVRVEAKRSMTGLCEPNHERQGNDRHSISQPFGTNSSVINGVKCFPVGSNVSARYNVPNLNFTQSVCLDNAKSNGICNGINVDNVARNSQNTISNGDSNTGANYYFNDKEIESSSFRTTTNGQQSKLHWMDSERTSEANDLLLRNDDVNLNTSLFTKRSDLQLLPCTRTRSSPVLEFVHPKPKSSPTIPMHVDASHAIIGSLSACNGKVTSGTSRGVVSITSGLSPMGGGENVEQVTDPARQQVFKSHGKPALSPTVNAFLHRLCTTPILPTPYSVERGSSLQSRQNNNQYVNNLSSLSANSAMDMASDLASKDKFGCAERLSSDRLDEMKRDNEEHLAAMMRDEWRRLDRRLQMTPRDGDLTLQAQLDKLRVERNSFQGELEKTLEQNEILRGNLNQTESELAASQKQNKELTLALKQCSDDRERILVKQAEQASNNVQLVSYPAEHWNSNDFNSKSDSRDCECSSSVKTKALVAQVRSLELELEQSRDALSAFQEEMHREKERWLNEKNKVIAYQKQLQLNFVQMTQRNEALQAEVRQLTLDLERRHIRQMTPPQESVIN